MAVLICPLIPRDARTAKVIRIIVYVLVFIMTSFIY
jgi:hypothetical protein